MWLGNSYFTKTPLTWTLGDQSTHVLARTGGRNQSSGMGGGKFSTDKTREFGDCIELL